MGEKDNSNTISLLPEYTITGLLHHILESECEICERFSFKMSDCAEQKDHTSLSFTLTRGTLPPLPVSGRQPCLQSSLVLSVGNPDSETQAFHRSRHHFTIAAHSLFLAFGM